MRRGGGGYENLQIGANITNSKNQSGNWPYLVFWPKDLMTVYTLSWLNLAGPLYKQTIIHAASLLLLHLTKTGAFPQNY